jgi:beta-lactamase class A
MALFGNKNRDDEEYEDDDLARKPLRRKPKNKDFRDLSPENRKKRKEPKKPWGKKERLFVLLVIFLTAGTSAVLALSSRSWKLPGLPRLSIQIPRISLPFLGEETIIIEGDKEDKEASEKVISGFNELTKNLSGVYGFYVIDLESSYSYGVNEKDEFEPASLNKLPVILGLYMEAESGNLDLNSKYTLRNSDKLPGSGSLYSKPAGTILTYRDLIRHMGKESDNTAFNIARRFLGQEKIENVVRALGMENTVVLGNSQKTTPYDIGAFFQRLYLGGLISDDSKNELLDFMTYTLYEGHLTAGVPNEVRVAHKYGRELHIVNDAGIVFSEKPYVVVVMSKGIVEKEADQIFSQLSKIIYEGQVNIN